MTTKSTPKHQWLRTTLLQAIESGRWAPGARLPSEADLVRQKIKDGDEDESIPPHVAEPQQPFIRDPVLARAVDLIKGLAVVRQWRS